MKSSYPDSPPPYYQDEEITLKDLILKIQEFWRELWKNKIWIFLSVSLVAGLFLLKAWMGETTYTVETSFMVSESGSKAQSRVNSPFGQFDFGHVEVNRITEIAKSDIIIHDVLLNKVVVDNNYSYIGNHIIDIYDLHDGWESESLIDGYKDMYLKDFYFTHDSINVFTLREFRALNFIHGLVAGDDLTGKKGILTISYNDNTDIFKLSIASLHEALSLSLMNTIFEKLKDFYIERTVGRARRTHRILKVQSDSLLIVLTNTEKQLAYVTDRNRGFSSNISSLNMGKLKRESEIISQEYGEVLRNQKSLEFLLSQEMPEFQVIDRTFIPLKDEPSKLRALLIGSFLGGFLGGGYILSRKIVRDALKE